MRKDSLQPCPIGDIILLMNKFHFLSEWHTAMVTLNINCSLNNKISIHLNI